MALPENPGFAVSGGVHIGLLAFALISFSRTPQLSDAQESIPVAVVSSEQFNQIMKGEETAAEIKPQQRSEKIAETTELRTKPSPADAPKEIAAAPSPLKRQPEPGQAEMQEVANPARQGASSPPPHPAQETPKPDEPAEQVFPRSAQTKPAEAAKKPAPKFQPDQLAKLLQQEQKKERQKTAAKPKSGEEATEPQHKFDLGDIAKFLSKEAPQRKQARGQQLSQTASLGAPTATGSKMSPSLWATLDGFLLEQYKRCWNVVPVSGQEKYIPEIHVQFTPEGALIGDPQLLNPPSDPNLRALADSAMRAVRRCDPLRIPAQYQPYYEEWKGRIVRFDQDEML
jgi:colicin import membrane protein